jgi:RNA polymerase sigma factor (sigma-70 family)
MTEDEGSLWKRYETVRNELVVFYLPIVDGPAKYIARITGRDWEDLRQYAAMGLMKAIAKFQSGRGVEFRAFARQYIRGAILDSPELTRSMTRTQGKIYRKARRAESSLTKTLHRTPTIEEIAKKTRLTTEQIQNAFAALGVANPGELSEEDDIPSSDYTPDSKSYSHILIEESLASLNELEQKIVRLHYFEDMSHEEIAEELEIIPLEVTRIRERAIGKVARTCSRAIGRIRKRANAKVKGSDDEN